MVPPAVVPAVALVVGAVAGLSLPRSAWLVPVMALASAVAGYAWRQSISWLVLAAVACGLAAGGAALAANAVDRALHTSARQVLDARDGGFLVASLGPPRGGGPTTARAVLVEDASIRDDYVSLRVDLTEMAIEGAWRRVDGGVILSVNGTLAAGRALEWRAGRTIEAPITFRRPARYLNDGVPDLERDLALDGVTLLGTVKSGLLVTVHAPGGRMAELASEFRAHVRRVVARWIEPHDSISAALAAAVLIGDRTGLPTETRDALQAAGTYHVIAISGGNIAILASATMCLLLIVGLRGRLASIVAIVTLTGYCLAITAGPSVWRATLMAVLFLAARAIDHRSAAWNTTAVSVALMVVARPLDVRDPGFILTFGATIALLAGARVGLNLLPRHRVASWLMASLLASAAVEVALLPVSASLFSRVTAAGLLLNLAAVPLMGIVQISTLIVTVAAGIAWIAEPCGWVAHAAARALVDSANLVAVAPWSTARVPPPGLVLVTAYYGALATAVVCRRRLFRAGAAGTLVAAGLAIVTGTDVANVGRQDPRADVLRVTMFDVGQGESLLLEMPGGRRLLVDSGGAPYGTSDIGARVLAPALWARGVRVLDGLLVTHGDPDHLGGAGDVLMDFAPRRIWMGVPMPMHAPTAEVEQLARRLKSPVEHRRTGEVESWGEVTLRVLHPDEPDWERRRVRNDDSVVVEAVYRDVAILLTGDISADVERAIVPRLSPARTRILKVAHHGSRTSTSAALLEAVRPRIAIISAGRGNTFGHPAPEVVRRLEAIGATVLRTDTGGQITVETDGHHLWYATHWSRQ